MQPTASEGEFLRELSFLEERDDTMKPALVPLLATLLAGGAASAQSITHQNVNPDRVTRVATALDHLSIVEMPEPITMAAVGSSAVQIEWHANRIFIKPLRPGEATNLFVWTEHTRSSYEILAPGQIANAAFVIDQTQTPNIASAPTPKITEDEIQKAADVLIGQTLLQSAPVTATGIKPAKDRVDLRINEVVRDRDSVYVRYSISNRGKRPYRIADPNVFSLLPARGNDVLAALRDVQISDVALTQFEGTTTSQVPVRSARVNVRDVVPGATVEGVVSFKKIGTQPEIYQFLFSNDGSHRVEATAVL